MMDITLLEFEHYLGKLSSCTLNGDVDGHKDAVHRIKELWIGANESERNIVTDALTALRADYIIKNMQENDNGTSIQL
jgi:hypothetical protein